MERRLRDRLSCMVDNVLLPLMKKRVRRWSRMVESVAPLFPCYLFASFDFERDWKDIRTTSGLRDLVCSGGAPARVPERIIAGLKERCGSGPVELPPPQRSPGQLLRVASGPFEGFEAIFMQSLSGSERVVVLLSMMGVGARAVLSSSMVVDVT